MSINEELRLAIKNLINPQSLILILLVLLNAISAISVIYVKNQHRSLFIQLQELKSQQSKLNIQHSQLLLEESTIMSQQLVSHKAEQDYKMRPIAAKDISLLNINKQNKN